MHLSPDFIDTIKLKKGPMFVIIIVIPLSVYVTTYHKVRDKCFMENSFHSATN